MIEKAKKDYLEGMKYKDLAEKYGVSINTVKSWVNRHGWSKLKKTKGCTRKKKGAHKKEVQEGAEKKSAPETKERTEMAIREIRSKNIESGDLSEQQRLFCIYYIECFNATKAYQKAYGCGRDTARTNSSRLLTNANVKIEIDRLTNELLAEEELNSKLLAKRVFQKHIDIALADITDYTEFGAEDVPVISKVTGEQLKDENGELITYKSNYIHLKSSGEIDGSLIAEVSQGKDGVKVKLADKMRALQWLSDRMDLLSTADRERFRIAQERLDHERNSDTVGEINVNIVSKE